MREFRKFNPTPVLVINAHPDDESFGFGGTIAKLSSIKRPLLVASLTSGEKGQSAIPISDPLFDIRRGEFTAATQSLGLSHNQNWIGDLPDGNLSSIPEAVNDAIAKLIQSYQPGLIMTMHPDSTSHPDHITVAKTILELKGRGALRSAGVLLQYLPHKITPQTTDIHVTIPIGPDFMEKKLKAIHSHATQRKDAEKIIPNLLSSEHFVFIP